MSAANHPPRELIRVYMESRRTDKTPPPSLEEIRQILGWGLVREAAQIRTEAMP